MTSSETKKKRKWYEKKRYLIPLGILVFIFFLGLGSSEPEVKQNVQITPSYQSIQYAPPVTPSIPVSSYMDSGLSNDNYYTNVNGNTVHSPAYSNSVPSGASAQCRDGTYSFSQNHRGTCSHHGGVSRWL